jgi:hypothetical protein
VTQAKRAATPEPQEPGLDAGTVTFRDAVATARVGGDRVAPGVEQEDYGSPRCGGYRLDMTAEHRLADQMLRSTRFALLVVAAIVLRGQVWGSLSPRRRPHRDRPRGGRYRKHRRRARLQGHSVCRTARRSAAVAPAPARRELGRHSTSRPIWRTVHATDRHARRTTRRFGAGDITKRRLPVSQRLDCRCLDVGTTAGDRLVAWRRVHHRQRIGTRRRRVGPKGRGRRCAFGGDPNRVTLMGQSAGGRLTRAAVASSQTKGLFHRAISQRAPVRIEQMLTRAEGEKAGLAEAARIGAASLAELRAAPAGQIQGGMLPGRLVSSPRRSAAALAPRPRPS